MKIAFLLVGFIAIEAYVIPNELQKLSGQELVDYINKQNSTFRAELGAYHSFYPDMIKNRLMPVKMIEIPAEYRSSEMTHPEINDATIPNEFDARTKWPNCPTIPKIRDQASCASGWSIAAAEAISDRICIVSPDRYLPTTISVEDINSCCGKLCGHGCGGGYPIEAWRRFVSRGYVSGGWYNERTGCKPYPYPPCDHYPSNASHYQPCPSKAPPTEKCEMVCQPGYAISYMMDLKYGKTAYAVSNKAAEIQKEIMTHGPVEAAFTVYEDFEHYSGGVYAHTAGSVIGGHAVKMLGWGVDNGTPYWLCANSWNEDWGEKGYFRILRGINECGIESGVVAGHTERFFD